MNQPTPLERVTPFSGRYSLRADIRLNLWLTIGVGPAIVWTPYLVEQRPEWGVLTKAAVLLVPLIPCVLQIRAYMAFVRNLDELQRKIQTEAWLLALCGTMLIGGVIGTLNEHGVEIPSIERGLTLSGMLLLTALLWPIGSFIANRRYK